MPVIKEINSGRIISCEDGECLLDVLIKEKIQVENPCNGMGTCGKCKVIVNGKEELACQIQVTEDMILEVPNQSGGIKILSDGYLPEFVIDQGKSGYGVAVDIGTTTIAMELVDLTDGKILAKDTAMNAQRIYGQDVLTRITYEVEHGEEGIRRLQEAVVESLNQGIALLCQKTCLLPSEIVAVSIAANCTMTHMLLGVDARSIGMAPYRPVFYEAQHRMAREIGIKVNKEATLYCLPQVSGYIGGDIVAGGYVCQIKEKHGNHLFLDIGTNGEMILATKGKMYACSCAAGPALEGMNITCGMPAHEGAVEAVKIKEQKVLLKTIGDAKPVGICGSGILEVVAALLQNGFVKKTGAFVKKDKLTEDDWHRAYLYQEDQMGFLLFKETDLRVSQQDVRQVQLAKGAILSGFLSLVNQAKLSIEELDEVLIAGQFGSHLSAEALCGVGLLPEEVEHKVRYVGNTSMAGAYMALLSDEASSGMERLATEIQYYELAESENYEQLFMECMRFPG